MNHSRHMMASLAESQGFVRALTSSEEGHTHFVVIPDIVSDDPGNTAGPMGIRVITWPSPKDAHTHEVELSGADLKRLADGETVMATTSKPNNNDHDGHVHTVEIDRTMRPTISPEVEGEWESMGSINSLGKLPSPRAGKKRRKKPPMRGGY